MTEVAWYLDVARILDTATRPKAWAEWSSLTSCSNVDLRAPERYEHFYLVIQAAVSQLGVAIVPRYLIEEEIESGQLVAPFGFVQSGHTLNLWIAPHERFRNDVRRLAAWIKERME